MAKTLTTFILAIPLFVLSLISFAQSQLPPPRQIELNKQQEDRPIQKEIKSYNKQRGTDDLPLVVKIVDTPASKTQKGNDTKNVDLKSEFKWWSKPTDTLLVIFNGLLAIFTFFLWWSTHKMWKATEKSADIAYKAFIAANHPRLQIRHIHSDPKILPVWVYISNIGGSNATNVELRAIFALKAGTVRKAPWIDNLSKSIWYGPTILAPREEASYELRSKSDVDMGSFDTNFAISTDTTLLIIGEVRYKDANQTERKIGFGWTYDPSIGEFTKPEKEDKYNYED